MKRITAAFFVACIAYVPIVATSADDRTFEQQMLDIPSASGALQSSMRINETMHFPGTTGDHDLAVWMRDQLQANGFEATLEPFAVDVPQPKRLSLTLLGKTRLTFDLHETPIPEDPDGSRTDASIPFNEYSGNGTITSVVVDAGHGTDDDFNALAKANVDVRKRIVLIRYGREFRGLLARRAQMRGAAGVIFFSDPLDSDGPMHGPAYPNGPYRPLGAVQRGSLGMPRLMIPTLPVSANVATRIIATMNGGHLSTSQVRLVVQETLAKKKTTLWNTVGVLAGSDPTQTVILGGHRDAWVYGVTDNGSGISTLLETARALGYLYKSGWRPKASILIVGFDGEEIGEVGSEAYVKTHADDLRRGCIAYVNEDEDATGQTFVATAAASLQGTIAPVTLRVDDPQQTRRSMYDRWKTQKGGVRIAGPSGGSDFEAFVYDLGIPMVQLGFDGPFGVYHSAYDDFQYANTQADPGFVNHRAVAQMVGLLAMRLANGPSIYRFAPYAPRMRASLAQLTHQGIAAADLAPLAAAIGRFATRAARSDAHRTDAPTNFDLVHQVNLLYYGRNGYAAVAFPAVTTALMSGNHAALVTAIAKTASDLDAITKTL